MKGRKDFLAEIQREIRKAIVGREKVVEALMICLISEGHALIEGVPGIAKTTLAKLYAQTIGLSFSRIQFTPDLLPADVIGCYVFDRNTGKFELKRGPVFANVVLVDEINRAPPRTQSSLLEAMQERQVTIEGNTLPIPLPFLLIATQNPIELEGTYPLPEAQVDRFMFKIEMSYPTDEEELEILALKTKPNNATVKKVLTKKDIQRLIHRAKKVHVSDAIMSYIRDIVAKTRRDERILLGASTRASEHLLKASRAKAALSGRDYVVPDDVKDILNMTLKHRLILSTEAELEDISIEEVLEDIIKKVEVPKEA